VLAIQQGRVDQAGGISLGNGFASVYGLGHRVQLVCEFSTHFHQTRFGGKVYVPVIVEKCNLVPDERCRSQGTPEDQLTGAHVLFSIDTKFVFHGLTYGSKGRDILSYPVAQALRFPENSSRCLTLLMSSKRLAPLLSTLPSAQRMAVTVRTGQS
jgi:hypothetical protein